MVIIRTNVHVMFLSEWGIGIFNTWTFSCIDSKTMAITNQNEVQFYISLKTMGIFLKRVRSKIRFNGPGWSPSEAPFVQIK